MKITPSEAEVLAHQAVEQYMNQCAPRDQDECCKVLINLFYMCGLALVGLAGRDRALQIAETTMQNMSRPELKARVELVRPN